jgi:hypothetical protein
MHTPYAEPVPLEPCRGCCVVVGSLEAPFFKFAFRKEFDEPRVGFAVYLLFHPD